MAQLTEHFEDHELGVEGCEGRLIDNATFLCSQILEPIRAKFGPVHVHDGYRDPGHNAAVGGKTASFHLFTDGHAAADIDALPTVSIPALFDWLRLESGLKFDKVILETNAKDVPACVHIQIDRLNPPRRQAFIGHTGAATHYEDQVSPSCRNQHASRAHAAKTTPYRKPFSEPDGFHSRGRRGGGTPALCSSRPRGAQHPLWSQPSSCPIPQASHAGGQAGLRLSFPHPGSPIPGCEFCHRFSQPRAGGMRFPNLLLQECTQIHRYALQFFPT